MWTYAIVALSCLAAQVICDDRPSPRVVIIGAGPSGIAAASKLLENNFEDVTILEAENRIGGRVNTVDFDGYAVDLGAEWVHGEKGNVVYELVNPLGLVENINETYKLDGYTSSGVKLDSDLFQGIVDHYKELQYGGENISNPEQYNTVGDYYKHEFRAYFDKHPEINETFQNEILDLLNTMQVMYDSADTWDDVAFSYHDMYHVCEGNQVINWKGRGYSTALDVLMKKIPDPEKELPVMNKTVLNAEVKKIDYSDENGPIKIETTDGKQYLADHVIVTVSLGVLKAEYENWFDPPLSETKINAIKGLEFGVIGKIFLSFDEPWWKDEGVIFLWSQNDKEELQNDPNRKWLLQTLGFFAVEHKPRLLSGWMGGIAARQMETLSADQVKKETMNAMREFLSHDFNITEPKDIIKTNWYSNKHFRGTYSYRSPNTLKMGATSAQLAEPIMRGEKPCIQFAGEATNTHHYSTVHGAIETGWREADRIINLYK